MKNKILILLVYFFILVNSSCVTMFMGSKQTLTIDSSPQGARVQLKGSDVGITPLKLKIQKKPVPLNLDIQKDGYQNKTLILEHQGEPALLWNTFNLFLFSWIDILSGAWVKYEDYTKVILTPLVNQDESIDNNIFEKLNKLKILLDNDILTQDEFDEQKRELLEK